MDDNLTFFLDLYLEELPVASWGQGYSTTKYDDRHKGAEWFARQIRAFSDFLEHETSYKLSELL